MSRSQAKMEDLISRFRLVQHLAVARVPNLLVDVGLVIEITQPPAIDCCPGEPSRHSGARGN